ncbi:hypothetical protein [Klebsiella pneumoniae]|uniref:hypothetical protein n=2 Tax=Klebsiella pneumoniae TaxID=573 RepID=UPI000C7D2B85|nr:hypothetical protein [Klebsiella pneumoniae]PLI62851.1 hypothetical protein B6J50_24365 [Klebsiella pneumoniae]
MIRLFLLILALLLAVPTYGLSVLACLFIHEWLNKQEAKAIYKIFNTQLDYLSNTGNMNQTDFFMTRSGVKKFLSMYLIKGFHTKTVSENDTITYSGIVFFKCTEVTAVYFTYPKNSYRRVTIDYDILNYRELMDYANPEIMDELKELARDQLSKAANAKKVTNLTRFNSVFGIDFNVLNKDEIVSIIKQLIRSSDVYLKNTRQDVITDPSFIRQLLSTAFGEEFIEIYDNVQRESQRMYEYISEAGLDFEPSEFYDKNLDKIDLFTLDNHLLKIDHGQPEGLGRYLTRMRKINDLFKAIR